MHRSATSKSLSGKLQHVRHSCELSVRPNYLRSLGLAGLRRGYVLQYRSERLSLDGTWLGGYAFSILNLNLGTMALAKGREVSVGVFQPV